MKYLLTEFSGDEDLQVPAFLAMVSVPYRQVEAIKQAAEPLKSLPGAEETRIDLRHGDFPEKPCFVAVEERTRVEFTEPSFIKACVGPEGKYYLHIGYVEEYRGEVFASYIYDSGSFSPEGDSVMISDECLDVFVDETEDGKVILNGLYEEASQVLPATVLEYIRHAVSLRIKRDISAT